MTTIGVIKGDTRSLDNGSYRVYDLGFRILGFRVSVQDFGFSI